MARNIYVTEVDKKRLQKLIDEAKEFEVGHKEYLLNLEYELNRAQVVFPEKIPNDVITMNSKVALKDLDSGEEIIFTLVYPADADLNADKISIFAPVGTAIIGYRLGDIIEWKVPAGMVRLEVVNLLYQPEAAGDYEL